MKLGLRFVKGCGAGLQLIRCGCAQLSSSRAHQATDFGVSQGNQSHLDTSLMTPRPLRCCIMVSWACLLQTIGQFVGVLDDLVDMLTPSLVAWFFQALEIVTDKYIKSCQSEAWIFEHGTK